MLSIMAISETGEGYGLAQLLSKERNFVKFYCATETGRGIKLPKKVDRIEETEEDSDITICCQNTKNISAGAGRLASLGKFVIGSAGLYSNFLNSSFLKGFYSLISEQLFPFEDMYNYEVWAMFNGTSWLPFFIINGTTLRINGNRGARCVSTSNCVIVSDTFRFRKVFDDITGFLNKQGFVGFIGMKFVNNSFAGVCTTLNLGMFYALHELMLSPMSELFLAFISGEMYKPRLRKGFGISILLSSPPYPFFSQNVVELDQMLHLATDSLKHFVIEDIVLDRGKNFTGTFGGLGWATAFGSSVREARRRVLRTVSNIVVQSSIQYTDYLSTDFEPLSVYLKEEENATLNREVKENSIEQHQGVSPLVQEDGQDRECVTSDNEQSPAASNSSSVRESRQGEINV